jgi:hypothetical protein
MRDMTAAEFTQGSRILPLDDPELLAIVRRYQKLRTQLVPYIYNAAWEAHEIGLPLMRAPLLHYPDDPNIWEVKREYLFGSDIYVAPVVEEGAARRTLYLPEGEWIELWALTEYDETTGGFRLGGVPIDGGREITVDAPIDEIPLFVKMGAVIPLVDPAVDTFAPADPPSRDFDVTTAEDLTHLLHVWVFADGVSSTTLADESSLTAETDSSGVLLTRTGPADDHELIAQVIWPQGLSAPANVTNCTFVPGGDPLTLAPGEWTWNNERNAVSFHGLPGQKVFSVIAAR